jgi:uncharacterized integral membrane protein (TIGR00697 family)
MNSSVHGKVRQYKFLACLSMLYLTLKLTTILLIYKIINLGPISFSVSTVIMPFWFFLGTIIAETYGYRIARHLIWAAIICQFLFSIICYTAIQANSPSWVHQSAYEEILGRLPRVAFASFLAIMCGAFINAYALAKYKILTKGKHFWLRALGASTIGEFVFTVIAYIVEFIGVLSYREIFQMMTVSFLVKVFLSPILVILCVIFTKRLKKAEGLDIFDFGVNFNPFKLDFNYDAMHRKISSNVIKFPLKNNNKLSSRTNK